MIDRRSFLKMALAAGVGAASWSGCRSPEAPHEIAGELVGTSHRVGHRLREGELPRPATGPRVDTVILGAGIAGLSAAWKLHGAGYDDFLLLELEPTPGGNSRFELYPESRAPWAAHYLPVPTAESRAVQELLAEMELLRGFGADGSPLYDERHLCHFPQERVFVQGRWEEGLFPMALATGEDLRQLEAFGRHVDSWRGWRDNRGRKAFAIPVAHSSDAAELRALDALSMGGYLQQLGFSSPLLRWYVEYGCRDDYGTSLDETSAWAGLHYFASRDGGGFETTDAPFVWPEGNGRLVEHLAGSAGPRLVAGALVCRIERAPSGFAVDYMEVESGKFVRLRAGRVICALPTFTRPYLLGEAPRSSFTYCPWVTANVVLSSPPRDPPGSGFPLSWDNVVFGSPSLGYVVATHQRLSRTPGPTVLTWYFPLLGEPDDRRRWLLGTDWGYWKDRVLGELRGLHPGLDQQVRRLDVMGLGHAMIRPTVGFRNGKERRQAAQPAEGVYFAHSDLSGLSIFEEAQYHGVRAAQELLRDRKHPHRDSLA
ncbi:MAG: NAD(P)-binding protein [Armatimonadetes bacterium]|nr:NAD(P)-binding protein [Armatimonadota bacterium]